MKNLSNEAITLLRKAVEIGKTIPESFDMNWWNVPSDAIVYDSLDTVVDIDSIKFPEPPCGTVGCLAFKLQQASGKTPSEVNELFDAKDPIEEAERLLNIKNNANIDLRTLFLTNQWPTDLWVEYRRAKPFTLDRVLVLEKAVERFIENDGHF